MTFALPIKTSGDFFILFFLSS